MHRGKRTVSNWLGTGVHDIYTNQGGLPNPVSNPLASDYAASSVRH